MALYEGIALIQEKQAVVLDLGTDYTKFGFTGEAAPRCIVRSSFWCGARRALRRVHDYRSADELYDNLVTMLHLLYFRYVLVNPKERKVVVVESLLTPTLFRETLAKVLFTHFEVSGVMWADTPRLCALTLGTPVALIVSIGAEEVEVAAVVHGCVIVSGVQSGPLGARAVRRELLRLLREDNDTLELTDTQLEDIAAKTCFVIPRSRAEQWRSGAAPTPARAARYTAALAVSGRARELAAEVMFARDGERGSLPELVLACVSRAPLDARRELSVSVLVAGGGAALPGLRARLRAELEHLRREDEHHAALRHLPPFAFHSAPAHANSVAWAGGAAAGAADAARALPRDVYCRERRLRDWACLLDNTPPDHPARLHADLP